MLTDVAYLDDAIDMQQFRGGDPRGDDRHKRALRHTISNCIGEWYAQTRSAHNYRAIIDKVVPPSLPSRLFLECTAMRLMLHYCIVYRSGEKCKTRDNPPGGVVRFRKNRHLVTAQTLPYNCRGVETVRVKEYWNYWKYRITLYMSEREYCADRSNRKIDDRIGGDSGSLIFHIKNRLFCPKLELITLSIKSSALDACRKLIVNRCKIIIENKFQSFRKVYLGKGIKRVQLVKVFEETRKFNAKVIIRNSIGLQPPAHDILHKRHYAYLKDFRA